MALRSWTRRYKRANNVETTAAATEVRYGTEEGRRTLNSVLMYNRRDAQTLWGHHDNIGEIHYSVARSARIAGYSEFQVVEVRDDGSDGDPITRGPEAEFLETLYSRWGGQRGLIERFYALMKVPADAVLVRVRDKGAKEPDGFAFLSSDEVENDDPTQVTTQIDRSKPLKWITLPGASPELRLQREVAPEDVLGRIWHPSFRWLEAADSPLMALGTECEVLRRLTMSMKARINSRLALNGILGFPSEIREVFSAQMKKGAGDSDILDYIMMAASMNSQSPDAGEAALPLFVRAPAEALKAIHHFVLDSSISETDLKLRAELINRILFGMDVQKTAVEGEGQANHWGSWHATDEERRVAVSPDMENFCWAMERLAMRPFLLERNVPPERIVKRRLTFHLDEAAVRTNRQEDVRQAADRGYANMLAIKRSTGLADDETLDPNSDEFVRFIGRLTREPRLALWGTKSYDRIPWEEIKTSRPSGPTPDKDGDDVKTGPGVGDPGSPNGQKRSTPKSRTPS